MIEEKKPPTRFAGSSAFIVRGSSFLPLDRAAILRPRYNEYPERFPFVEGFPQPGRRGGSRPRGVPGGAEGEGGEGQGAGGVVENIYPVPRDRDGHDIPGGGDLPASTDADATAINRCAADGGVHIQFAQQVAAGTTDRRITTRFSRPFIIRYVGAWTDTLDVNTSRLQVRIVNNNDISAGADGDGYGLDEGAIGAADFGMVNALQQSFPNKRVTNVPAYLKFMTVNNTAGIVSVQFIADIEWLD